MSQLNICHTANTRKLPTTTCRQPLSTSCPIRRPRRARAHPSTTQQPGNQAIQQNQNIGARFRACQLRTLQIFMFRVETSAAHSKGFYGVFFSSRSPRPIRTPRPKSEPRKRSCPTNSPCHRPAFPYQPKRGEGCPTHFFAFSSSSLYAHKISRHMKKTLAFPHLPPNCLGGGWGARGVRRVGGEERPHMPRGHQDPTICWGGITKYRKILR